MNPLVAAVVIIAEAVVILVLVLVLVRERRNARRAPAARSSKATPTSPGQPDAGTPDVRDSILSNLHHEVRTPLNGALGMLALLEDGNLTAEQRVFVGLLRDSLTDLERHLTAMLDLSGSGENPVTLRRSTFPLLPLVHDVYDLSLEAAVKKGLSLDYEFSFDPELIIHTDRSKLAHCLLHLLLNAVKFTEQGTVLFRVTQRHPLIRFAVLDTGIGLDADLLEQAFDLFVQGDMSLTKRHRGLGIGLAVTRRLIERMGGRVSVESVPNRGSTFLVELPLAVSPDGTG